MPIRPADHGIFASSGAGAGGAGYFCGGITAAASGGVTTVDRFAFPDDSRSTLGTGLSAVSSDSAGFANSGTAGYVTNIAGGGAASDVVNKFAFVDDSRTTLGTGLSTGATDCGAMANSGTAGYVALGVISVNVTTVDKFAFPGDGRTTLGTGLSVAVAPSGAETRLPPASPTIPSPPVSADPDFA